MTARDVLARKANALIARLTAAGERELRDQVEDALDRQRVWVLHLRAPAKMRSVNEARRLHWGKTSAERRMLREVTQAEARSNRLPTGLARVRVDILLQFTDNHERSVGNHGDQVAKPIVDALGPAKTVKDDRQPGGYRVESDQHGLFADDNQTHVDGPFVTIGEPVDKRRFPFGRITVTITDLSGGEHARTA